MNDDSDSCTCAVLGRMAPCGFCSPYIHDEIHSILKYIESVVKDDGWTTVTTKKAMMRLRREYYLEFDYGEPCIIITNDNHPIYPVEVCFDLIEPKSLEKFKEFVENNILKP